MLIAEARVPTDRASRYLVQLCRHIDHMRRMRHQPPTHHGGGLMPPGVDHVDYSDTYGSVRFAEGRCTLEAAEGILTLRVQAADEAILRRLQDGIGARLEKIGRRNQLVVTWQRLPTSTTPSGEEAPGAASAPDSTAGKNRWCGRLGTLALVVGGALVIAVHLGLFGPAVSAAAWAGWTSNAIVAIILIKAVFVAGHLVLGRFAFRQGKAVHTRWKLRRSTSEAAAISSAAGSVRSDERP
ncbi:DUF2218 domain-containing protein [Saccharopolyspora sp. ID03-671]|uniref:DUF2218 domain-containing protein n=1 Tax=Saccharopolyspora sp. ID03-671 TaxID=3073066 RepID=UPI00324F789E